MKVLYLTLKKAPFEVMITGEKQYEIREKGSWINSRLFNPDGSKRQYDVIKFTNGYGKNRPYFIALYLGVCEISLMNEFFSNGFQLEFYDPSNPRWMINLGEILETGNLKGVK